MICQDVKETANKLDLSPAQNGSLATPHANINNDNKQTFQEGLTMFNHFQTSGSNQTTWKLLPTKNNVMKSLEVPKGPK